MNSPAQFETVSERSNTQKFWLALIRDIFGIIKAEDYVDFEKRVDIEHAKYIDVYIPSTGTIIEQKSPGKNLDDAFIQAKNYYDWLPFSQRGRYIITCDFNELHVHDMEQPTKPPEIIAVQDATKDNLSFLLTPGEIAPIEVAVSVKAGELVKSLYSSLLDSLDMVAKEQHYDKDTYDKARDNINIFCVRLVFLLYAEDSGLFAKSQFHDYLKPRAIMARDALAKLFTVLNTDYHSRDPFLEPELKAFPHVNGGLFAKTVDFPQLSPDELHIIIHDMAEGFNWSGISPVIFGAIFEATINDDTRKKEGIHYTSPTNIHKVIDPLFLDGLNETLKDILKEPQSDARTQKLLAFQDKLAALRFLDPACGSGNFLTESFICLRRMENSLLAAIPENQRPPVKVEIKQFNGIEAHDFAVNIAKTALWISDHQMWKETREILRSQKPPLPLTDYDGIEECDALRADLLVKGWKIEHEDMLYIMGNPPFIGYSDIKGARKDILSSMFDNWKVDYVAGWFHEASKCVQDKNTKAAFVATNSVVQGEQVSGIFGQLHNDWGIKIDFAHQPFVWKNELPDKTKMAHVHVVIVCISTNPPAQRRLYAPDGTFRLVDNINFYLQEGPDEDIAEPHKHPICRNVPEIDLGNLPRDGGHLIIEAGDYADFIKREPGAERFIRRYVGAYEFINNIPRWCLWLVGVNPDKIRNMPLVYKRVKAVEAFRNESRRAATKKLAKTSWLFAEIRQPASEYIVVPLTSSEERRYVPMGFMTPDVIPSNAVSIIPGATLYDFGVLTSRVHMAWMRYVCGRLKSDYRYSGDMVYNTFPWPDAGVKDRGRIEGAAQGILDARAESPGVSFAGLYDDAVMPVELRRAHERNDEEVCRAYGWPGDIGEEEIVARLFGLYHRLTGKVR